ncbi:hypothetical protein ACVXG7_19280 [Enterobacter hormaechei]
MHPWQADYLLKQLVPASGRKRRPAQCGRSRCAMATHQLFRSLYSETNSDMISFP